MDSDVVIRCEGLSRRFGQLQAVDGVEITVNRGEIFGFLGPNGAGKTTTVRMLTTMDLPTSGRVWINGYDTHSQYLDARRKIGVIQQMNSLDKDISVRENIMHHALMQGMSVKEARERMDELCGIMELNNCMNTLVENLSGGWKKRVSIVCSMIHSPDILFMDEPTTGLDTQSRNLLWKMIRALNRGGTTIFLTTHYIYEAEALCDRIAIISAGRIIAEGSPSELIAREGRFVMVRETDEGERTVTFMSDRKEAMNVASQYSGEHNTVVRKTTLEDVYLRLTGGIV